MGRKAKSMPPRSRVCKGSCEGGGSVSPSSGLGEPHPNLPRAAVLALLGASSAPLLLFRPQSPVTLETPAVHSSSGLSGTTENASRPSAGQDHHL